MSGSGAAKVLSSLHSFHGQEDELAQLLSLTEALRAHRSRQEGEGARLSAEESAVLGALRDRLSRLAGEARQRLERALLKVELLRRHLQKPSGDAPASAGNERRELMIRKLRASYLTRSETAYQEAREAVLAASSKAGEPARDTASSEERQERARSLVQRASVIALAGYLADVESSQPSGVLNALRDEVAAHVAATLRIENALRTLDGMAPSATAAPDTPAEPAEASAPVQEPQAQETRAPEARKNRTKQPTRPRGKKTASPGATPGAGAAGGADAEAASQEAASQAVEAPAQAPPSPRKRNRRGAAK